MTTSRGPKPPTKGLNDAVTPGPGEKKSIRGKLSDPGFTPSIRAIDELLALFADEDEDVAKAAERAVLRIEAQYAARVALRVVDQAKSATRPARGRLTHLLGRLASTVGRDPDNVARAWVISAVGDEDPKTRRASARALGKMERSPEIEAALASAFDRASTDDDKKALALSLGKVGGDAARERLSDGMHARASLLLEREAAREQHHGEIDASRKSDKPLRVWFHTRSGLEDVVKEELVSRSFSTDTPARFVSPGIVEGMLASGAPLSHATQIRTALHIGFPLTPLTAKSNDTEVIADAIVRAVSSKEALTIFRAFTTRDHSLGDPDDAPIRFRLAFAKGGHRRALVWRCAELMSERERSLVNDPKDSTWEVIVDEVPAGDEGQVQLKIELLPHGLLDDRFLYRKDLVAASSHPVIAAALIRVAPRHDDDVIWDPFAGAGAELVERTLIGPFAKLIGTDVDAKAVKAARNNIARAGIDPARVTIEEGDASAYVPSQKVTLIITNPPMGRRVERGTHGDLLVRFVTHAADILAPGGALVWMVPEPQAPIHERAASVGLHLVRAFTVDMGGFSAELSIFMKRPKTSPRTMQNTRRIIRNDRSR